MFPIGGSGGLRFSLVGVPVTVHPTFLVIAFLLGSTGGDLGDALVGGGVVFLSILGHELGHAVAAQAYGMPHPEVVIHALGGHTQVPIARSRWGRFATAAAGPLAGFGIGLVALGAGQGLQGEAGRMADWAWQVGWFWSLANMVPLLPLDGGRVLVELLPGSELVRLRRARLASVATGAVAAAVAASFGELFITVLGAWFAASNLVDLRRDGAPTGSGRRRGGDVRRIDVRLEEAFRELTPASAEAAEALAWSALGSAPEGGRTFPASVLLAALLVQQRHVEAWELLGRLQARDVDPYLRTIVELGPTASEVLDHRLDAGAAGSDLDVALLARAFAGRWDAAADLAAGDAAGRLQKGWLQLVTGWAFHGGAFAAAARLGEAVERRDAAAWTSVNVACAYAQLGRLDDAAAALGRAADRGWDDRRAAERDDDLAPLHDHPGWATFLARTSENQRRPRRDRGEPFVMPLSAASAFLLCAGAMVALLRVLPSEPDVQDRLDAMGIDLTDPDAHLPDELAAIDLATGEEVWEVDEPLLVVDAGSDLVVAFGAGAGGPLDEPSIVALDLATGRERWRIDGAIAPVLVGGAVYASDADSRTVVALDPATGQRRWSEPGIAVVAGDETLVVVSRRDGSTAALDAGTGRERWRHDGAPAPVLPGRAGPLPPTLVVVDAGPERSEVVGIDTASGTPRWTAAGNEVVEVGPTHVYLGDGDGGILRVDLETGAAGPALEGAATHLGTSAGGTTVLATADELVAIDDATGSERWRAPVAVEDGTYPLGLAAVGDVVVVDDGAGLWALDLGTGATRWRHGDELSAIAEVVDDVVLAAQSPFDVVALDAADGTERWRTASLVGFELPVAQGLVLVVR